MFHKMSRLCGISPPWTQATAFESKLFSEKLNFFLLSLLFCFNTDSLQFTAGTSSSGAGQSGTIGSLPWLYHNAVPGCRELCRQGIRALWAAGMWSPCEYNWVLINGVSAYVTVLHFSPFVVSESVGVTSGQRGKRSATSRDSLKRRCFLS